MPAADDRKRRDRRPSAEERDLWHRAMRDAEPIRRKQRNPVDHTIEPSEPPNDSGKPPESADPPSGKAPPRPQPTPPIQPPPKRQPPLTPGQFADLDRRTADRLRRGQLAIDARLDLHGMTQAAAQDALLGFVSSAAERGQRCLLVITGKGTFSEQGGVLRREVPRWLNMAPLRGRIVAVAEAQPRHGGAGALYVLLKRKRG